MAKQKTTNIKNGKFIVKNFFHKCKQPPMLSSKELCGNKGVFEYFIEYISSVSIISLYIKLPQMYAFVKYFDIFSS